jgi:hypothetical protein
MQQADSPMAQSNISKSWLNFAAPDEEQAAQFPNYIYYLSGIVKMIFDAAQF